LIDAWKSAMNMGPLWPEIDRQLPEKGLRFFSSISIHELLAGEDERLEVRQRRLKWVRERFTLVDLSRRAEPNADHVFRGYLEGPSFPPPSSLGDWLIAAVAQSKQLALATFDKDFEVLEPQGLVLVTGLPREPPAS